MKLVSTTNMIKKHCRSEYKKCYAMILKESKVSVAMTYSVPLTDINSPRDWDHIEILYYLINKLRSKLLNVYFLRPNILYITWGSNEPTDQKKKISFLIRESRKTEKYF